MYKKLAKLLLLFIFVICTTSYASEIRTGNLSGNEQEEDFNEAQNSVSAGIGSSSDGGLSSGESMLEQHFTISSNDFPEENGEESKELEGNQDWVAPEDCVLRYAVRNDSSESGYLVSKLNFDIVGDTANEAFAYVRCNDEDYLLSDDIYFNKISIEPNSIGSYTIEFPTLTGEYTIEGTFSVVMVRDNLIEDSQCFLLSENDRSNILTTSNSHEILNFNDILCDGATFNSKLKELTSSLSSFQFITAPINYTQAFVEQLPLVDVSMYNNGNNCYLCLQDDKCFVVTKSGRTPILNRVSDNCFESVANCSSIDISSFRGKYVRQIGGMFANTTALKSVKLPNELPNVVNIGALFYKSGIEVIDLRNISVLGEINYAPALFCYCENLREIYLPDCFNTKNATDLHAMFDNDHELGYVDLSKIQTDSNIDFSSMFYSTKNLKA